MVFYRDFISLQAFGRTVLCFTKLGYSNLTSIIIPTLNEATQIKDTLEAVFAMKGSFEVIVVDGGSKDQTLCMVQQFPEVRLFPGSDRGRAIQMNKGAREAKGKYLLFLHADTRPSRHCIQQMENRFKDPGVVGGSFSMLFDHPNWYYRLLSFLTRFNCRFWTFGDQGIFVRKSVFLKMKGYSPLPILEDLELQIRLRKIGKFVKVPVYLKTSSRRYRLNGFGWEFLLDAIIVIAFFLGVSPMQLKRWYDLKKRDLR